jgi:hypothetical protein
MISHEVISHKPIDAQPSSNREVSDDCKLQGRKVPRPMSVQNTCGFGSHELHPQELVRLVGCRDLNRPIPKAEVEFCWKRGSRLTRRKRFHAD